MLWDPLRVLLTPCLDPTALWLSWLPHALKASTIQTVPGLSWLPSTAPTAQFGGQGCAGAVYSQPGGDSWSRPCWGDIPVSAAGSGDRMGEEKGTCWRDTLHTAAERSTHSTYHPPRALQALAN